MEVIISSHEGRVYIQAWVESENKFALHFYFPRQSPDRLSLCLQKSRAQEKVMQKPNT